MAFYKITYPIMVLFNGITNAVVRIAGHDPANEHEVYTDDEIKLLIDESTESGLIAPEQNEFVDNASDIADKDAESLMTPRPDMVCLCMNDSLEENMRDRHRGEVHAFSRCTVATKTISWASCERERPVQLVA